jgi:uncharacterized protein
VLGCLYDSSVWVALSFASHVCHSAAAREFAAADSGNPAVFCRATQISFLRLLTTPVIQSRYGSDLISNAIAWNKCQELLALPQVAWMEEPGGLELLWGQCASRPTASPKIWMDAWLAAFAMAADIELATCDQDFNAFRPLGLKLRLLVPGNGLSQ